MMRARPGTRRNNCGRRADTTKGRSLQGLDLVGVQLDASDCAEKQRINTELYCAVLTRPNSQLTEVKDSLVQRCLLATTSLKEQFPGHRLPMLNRPELPPFRAKRSQRLDVRLCSTGADESNERREDPLNESAALSVTPLAIDGDSVVFG